MNSKPLAAVLISLESGSRPKGGVSTNTGEIPSIGGEHLNSNGGFNWTNIKHIPRSFFETMRSGRITKFDILVVKDGATTGKTSFVRDYFPFEEAAINEHVFCVRVNPTQASPTFVYHFLRSAQGQRAIQQDFRGATVGGISREFANRVRIPMPLLAEQHRIADILDRAEGLCAMRRAALAQLDLLIQSIFLNQFGDPIANRNGINVVRLADVATRITDGVHLKPDYTEVGIPFISVKNITTGKLVFDDCKFISPDDHERFTKRCKPERHDILYTKVGATYGRPALIDTDREFSIYVSVCLIKLRKELVHPHFLSVALGTSAVKRQADRRIKGIGVPDLHLDQIQDFLIPLPSMFEQREFARRVSVVERLKAAHRASLAELDNLLASLQDRAFSGEL